jgi:hypothetical protein
MDAAFESLEIVLPFYDSPLVFIPSRGVTAVRDPGAARSLLSGVIT